MDIMEEVRVYLRMDREIAKQFREIKRQLGLKNDTEVMRYLNKRVYEESKPLFGIPKLA